MNFQELAHKALQGIIPERAEPHLSLTNGKCQRNHRGSALTRDRRRARWYRRRTFRSALHSQRGCKRRPFRSESGKWNVRMSLAELFQQRTRNIHARVP